MGRLLVLGCSQRKRPDAALLPAIERYDGPAFRVVRRYLSECPAPDLAIYVLSAEYGLIRGNEPIADYDRRLTPDGVPMLAPAVEAALVGLSHVGDDEAATQAVLAVLGRDYLALLSRCHGPLARTLAHRNAAGSIGVKLAKLKRWLRDYGGHESASHPPGAATNDETARLIRLRGHGYALDRGEVERRVVHAFAQGTPRRAACAAWCADVAGQAVAPKWLVAVATGLSVASFTTDDACRVLRQLGIEVRQV